MVIVVLEKDFTLKCCRIIVGVSILISILINWANCGLVLEKDGKQLELASEKNRENHLNNYLLTKNRFLKKIKKSHPYLTRVEQLAYLERLLLLKREMQLLDDYSKNTAEKSQAEDDDFTKRILAKRSKNIRYLNKKGKGYYTRPCLVNVLSCYYFA